MLQDAYLLAKIGADTAENERNFCQKLATTLRVQRRRVVRAGERPREDALRRGPLRGPGLLAGARLDEILCSVK